MSDQSFAGSGWRDTPHNQQRWERLQNSNNFLNSQPSLDCSYCGQGPLRVVDWRDVAGQADPRMATVVRMGARR